MSNRFVSGGTIDANGEVSKDGQSETGREVEVKVSVKNAEWEAVQRELEGQRARREQEKQRAAMGEEKSLYEILQANKAAKQEAFEEKNKIRNQFRALDDDEVEFLDEVKARQRAEEEQVRRETEEGLKAFRERLKSDGGGEGDGGVGQEGEGVEEWAVGRKRKRVKEREVMVKKKVDDRAEEENKKMTTTTVSAAAAITGAQDEKKDGCAPGGAKQALGLVDYGSDSEDD